MSELNQPHIIYWALRLVLGILIAGAGVGKLLDIPGFVKVIHTYKLNLPAWLAWLIAVGVTVFELILGIAILSGFHLHTAAVWSIIMHTGYFVLLTTALLRKLELKNCGCFGVFLARPLMWYTPLEDLALIALSYWLLRLT
jgi:uncharacterized membrane protein YphA (DoxX/SURF4 family)